MKIESTQIVITSLEFNQYVDENMPHHLVTLTANVGDLQSPLSILNHQLENPANVAVLIALFEAGLPVAEINL